ncbi:prenylated Rab acceptor protein 1 [Scaptodrosophila lebanonensis]|uniref:PRA1 family protein n=1 Tax=Drosophila lebanonensis TaxID=7225 RepID=A0A6J2SZY7_DROLE|nr:prenylated Rab acceptor protein 1 [Scaptodrosophila lebanonensis]
MDPTKIDISGDMDSQPPPARVLSGGGRTSNRFSFDLQSLPRLQNLPSPLELVQMVRESLRPWLVFFNVSNFKTAPSMPRLSNRVSRNLTYFQSNYIFVFIVLMIYCLITSPLILLVLAGAAYACHKIRTGNRTITAVGREITPKQQLLIVNLTAAPVLFLVGAGSVLFWTLGASCFVIACHAIFYNIDAIVTEENEGFLAEVV